MFGLLLLPQDVAPKSTDNTQDNASELVELRLENKLREQLDETEAELSNKIATELAGHREYLQKLDDGFYSRIQFWLPILAGGVALFAGAFFWIVGKTQKDAFETAQTIAVSKATELAERRVSEVVIPENIVESAKKMNEETIAQITELKKQLTDEVTHELKVARDEVVQNKHEIIEQTLDAAIKERFKEELDVLGRIEKIEKRLDKLEDSNDELGKLIKLMFLKTSRERDEPLADAVSEVFTSTSRVTKSFIEFLIKKLI